MDFRATWLTADVFEKALRKEDGILTERKVVAGVQASIKYVTWPRSV